ncbi:uncharacterized protein BO80DRAFT_183626 [Aspergillus ibericus CBS 121593]|uniref:Uncharacterized protein n=1 Tax=Aspergillus ibericus CBS 121593 TaxID=1448316 RepID=A0A395GQD4_9EURO|nr:hypothetical protein BO80DRAFT_183626 [Aspergillus ibericus CBS 121593]RAK97689.1 hypothetical protein BO80DRAFT_183626 [Aspergillus ibericus CBS 121593]
MCVSKYIQKYTCDCKKKMEFEQCEERQRTNVKCHLVRKKNSNNYCSRHRSMLASGF